VLTDSSHRFSDPWIPYLERQSFCWRKKKYHLGDPVLLPPPWTSSRGVSVLGLDPFHRRTADVEQSSGETMNLLLAISASTSGPSFTVNGIVAWIIICGAVVAATVTVYKVVWPLTKSLVKASETWPKLDQLASMEESLTKIVKEFQPNGSASMRDSVDRIEKRVGGIDTSFKSLSQDFKDHVENDASQFQYLRGKLDG
jgi:hypothetical protein